MSAFFNELQPVFDFMGQIWTAFPLAIRYVLALSFALIVGIIVIRSFVS